MILSGDPQIPMADTIFVDLPGKYLPPRPAESLVEVLPQRVIDAIANADSVESVLLCPLWEYSGRPRCEQQTYNRLLDPYGIRARGGYITASQKEELFSILLDPESYLVYQTPGEKGSCLCINEIAFLFTLVGNLPHRIERTAVVFSCCCASIVVRNYHNSITLDMTGASERLVNLSRAMYPEDSLLAEDCERSYNR